MGSGIVHGMISGHYAANAAIVSIREGMTNSQLMEEYERMMRQSDIVKAPFVTTVTSGLVMEHTVSGSNNPAV